MKKKILLATGCSFTDPDFFSEDCSIPDDQRSGWKMWPELMADELGLECVNRGRCGRGADHILDSIVGEIAIHGNKIDTVAILWSGCDRSPLFDVTLNPFTSLLRDRGGKNHNIPHNNIEWEREYNIETLVRDFWESSAFDKIVYRKMIFNQLTKMCAVVDICKANNIKLIMNQGIQYFSHWHLDFLLENEKITKKQYISRASVAHTFMSTDLFSKLDAEKDNIIGWPLLRDLGGTCWDDRRYEMGDTYVSDADLHPNAYGQTLIAKEFIEKYNDLYSV